MRKTLNTAATIIIATLVILTCLFSVNFSGVNAVGETDYYAEITAEGGTELLGQLHDLITTTHNRYTTYDDCKNISIVSKTDGGSQSGMLTEFYSQADISSAWDGTRDGTWNREHVWCKNLSAGLWGTDGGGSDLHHLRPAERHLNSERNNHKYGVAIDASDVNEAYYVGADREKIALGGYLSLQTDTFEPLDKVKGDVARILFYVYTHYNKAENVGGTTNGNGSSVYFGTLSFTNIVSAKSEADAINLLLEWNDIDPVDDIERTRNEEVFKIQGNRNPFIDDATYADKIWNESGSSGSSLVLDKTTITLAPRETTVITAVKSDGTVTWASSNTAVATVTQDGTVTAVKEGSAVITATCREAKKQCRITVENELTVSETSVTLTKGESKTLTFTATDAVTWTTTDSTVCTVKNGVITAVGAGIATVTASCGKASVKIGVTVTTSGEQSGKQIEITVNNVDFGNNSKYGFYDWKSGSVSGHAFVCKNSEFLQFNKKQPSYYLANSAPLPGGILSVTVIGNGTARDWQLFTSDTPYQKTEKCPTAGTDRGKKTVTESGASWSLDGTDRYFSLNYALSASTGAGYIEKITITYDDSTVTEEEPAKITEYKTAVGKIAETKTRREKFAAIKSAVELYNKLTAEEKSKATSETAVLNSAIQDYNAEIAPINEEANEASKNAAANAAAMSVGLAALSYLLTKKLL